MKGNCGHSTFSRSRFVFSAIWNCSSIDILQVGLQCPLGYLRCWQLLPLFTCASSWIVSTFGIVISATVDCQPLILSTPHSDWTDKWSHRTWARNYRALLKRAHRPLLWEAASLVGLSHSFPLTAVVNPIVRLPWVLWAVVKIVLMLSFLSSTLYVRTERLTMDSTDVSRSPPETFPDLPKEEGDVNDWILL